MRKIALFTAAALAASLAQADDVGSFTVLPYAALSVSADGKTVVGDYTASAQDYLWMWNASTGVVDIGGKSAINPGAGNAYISADASRIYGTALDANGVRNMSVYNVASGQWTSLGGLGGYSSTSGMSADPAANQALYLATGTAWGSSADGKYIVGQSYQTGGGTNNSRATIWNTQTGTLTNLGNNPGVTAGPNQRSRAQGISDDGRVVGGFGGGNTPLVWTDLDGDGVYDVTKVNTASGKTVNGVFAISGNGMYAVGAGSITNTSGSAYRYNVATHGIDMLGKLDMNSGGIDTATAVSATGSVIVGFEDAASGNPAARNGFIWIDGLGIQSLDSYLAGWGIDTDNSFNFATPTAISADGLNIVGFGYTAGSNASVSFVVNLPAAAAVPEPSSYALLLAGLGFTAALVRRRRRA